MVKEPVETIPIPVLECNRCGYKWVPRTTQKPKVCPKCKRHDWDLETPLKRKGGRKHGIAGSTRPRRKKTSIGPQTEKFLQLHSSQSPQNS